jgi:ribosome-binding ATPase
MQIGLVGLPYSGKTTLFQTLTETHIDPNALQKRDTNQAVVKVPDDRLDKLTEIFNPKKKVNATIEIVDLVGVQKGETAGSSITTLFLTKVRTNDALIHVVKGFEDESMPNDDIINSMIKDIRTLDDEFIFADMAFVESRFEKLDKEMKKNKGVDLLKKELEAMHRWNDALQNEIPLRELEMSEDELKWVKNYQPLTAKPLLIALNLSENDVRKSSEIIEKVKQTTKGDKIAIEPFFAKIEMELSQLPPDEKAIFMNEYGLTDSPLNRLIRGAYKLLGLQSFFTVGEDECRAWTIRKGMNAQESSGVIHTDFFNKFIRAEVVSYKDFIEAGTLAKCREKGHLRLEGKEYLVQDGDIINVRHG